MGAELSRLGGGIGTRGRVRRSSKRTVAAFARASTPLEQDLGTVRRRRAQLRDRRHKTEIPTAALVGYTNAGKTTLFNRLTKAGAEASDALFVTLDPLVRKVTLSDRRPLLLSDTVGFIDRLPHTLVAAFRATLEETADADLVLHVIDASNPEHERHAAAVHRVLEEVGATAVPRIEVFNKIDALTSDEKRRLAGQDPGALLISASTGEGCDALLESVAARLSLDQQRITLTLDMTDPEQAERLGWLYRHARVHSQTTSGDLVDIEADILRRLAAQATNVPAAPAAIREGRRRA
ncbi:MAG: GTPase HflX [Vicinamibacterales bacterium]